MNRRLLFFCFIPAIDSCTAYSGELANSGNVLDENVKVEIIQINVHPVFDESNPEENNALFRLVNRLHINTKESVIEKDLTFKKGDSLDPKLLQESERRLRERRYFAEAKVTAIDQSNETEASVSHVQVDVREVWTLIPKVSYSNAGGSSRYGYGLQDSNFLGLGKTVKVEQSSTQERTSSTIAYSDPNFGAGKQLAFTYADNSDGKSQEFHFSNPFRSFRTDWTAGVDLQDFEREDTLFNAGREAWRFGHDGSLQSLFYGQRFSASTDERTHRWKIGFDRISDQFYDVPETESNKAILPENRNYQVAWIEYSYLHNRFFETTNIQQINRTEDINLGSELNLRVGNVFAQSEQLNGSLAFELEFSKAYRISSNQLLTNRISTSGFYNRDQAINSISKIDLNYHWHNFEHGQLYVFANETYGKNLFSDMPLELGGDTGLRGYPTRFMAGDRSRLLTIEQRFFGEKEWFSLFHMGAAIFYDQGKAWGETKISQQHQETLRDIGIGLRISGTRTGGREDGAHNVAHIDLAYPLDANSIDKYQISVKIKTGF